MTSRSRMFLNLPDEARSAANEKAKSSRRRWSQLCEQNLPLEIEDSVWRFSRKTKFQEPSQGWKLHISATILEACELFEQVAPFLIAEDVQFKAPKSLDELSKINSGLEYGYHQIGKFITIYPSTEKQAVRLARELHNLTKKFFAVSVPFDNQFLPDSSVFYRYGAFSNIEATDAEGRTFPAIKDSAGELVFDDRFQAIPAWLSDPFQNCRKTSEKLFADTPLGTTFKVFRAITQRGKGGTYQAFDCSTSAPRLCIVKEGRRYGEVGWNGQDGYCLVKNEFEVLTELKKNYADVPQTFSSFEIYGNFYLTMEYVEGSSLDELMKPRRRRFSIKRVLRLAVEIAIIIGKIHKAGWIWNDCKPGNLIVTKNQSLRPIDFEGAFRLDQSEPFDWETKGFSKSPKISIKSDGKFRDLYAFGAVVYFLLTGKLYDAETPSAIGVSRRNVPRRLEKITGELLSDSESDIYKVGRELEEILSSV